MKVLTCAVIFCLWNIGGRQNPASSHTAFIAGYDHNPRRGSWGFKDPMAYLLGRAPKLRPPASSKPGRSTSPVGTPSLATFSLRRPSTTEVLKFLSRRDLGTSLAEGERQPCYLTFARETASFQ
eukprot:483335-Amphidinium_carterae.3